jgi:hypothetical protein
VVDKETPADFGTGMDLDPSEKAPHLRNETAKKIKPALPQKMSHSVENHGMEARVAKDYLKNAAGRRITFKNSLNIFS